MRRAVDALLVESRYLSNIASLALILFLAALALIGIGGITGISSDQEDPLSLPIGVLLSGVMILGILSMLGATWKVLRMRQEISDWGTFLIIVWLMPYIGVAIYLGGSNLLDLRKTL